VIKERKAKHDAEKKEKAEPKVEEKKVAAPTKTTAAPKT